MVDQRVDNIEGEGVKRGNLETPQFDIEVCRSNIS